MEIVNTLTEVLKGIREAVIMDERVRVLSEKTDRMNEQLLDTRERLIRVETVVGMMVPSHSISR